VRFAHERAGLTASRLREIAQRTAAGVERARAEMAAHARTHPAFRAIGAGMAQQWKAGVKLLSYFDALPKRAVTVR
jgi:hypothetical protein